MASSDNLVTIEPQPWRFGQAMADCWISDFFTKETETLTRALTKSFTNSSPTDHTSTDIVESLLVKPETTPSQTPTASGCSENEVPFSKRRNVAASGRITKRKSRASKRATTTFITADPANFRQMVQQVTGVRFGGEFEWTDSCCADAETRPAEQVVQPPVVSVPPPSTVMADGGAAGFSFDSYCSFPTLESWKVM
ncbi:Calmodulin-binding protein 25 [Abeliophyllum distichum]|uniref:Calmodulin-binding protein 25 n=1 Tax=Abeliophyllum distichum TaxID=126358 RepID=A0ABD1PPP1_9LAMI